MNKKDFAFGLLVGFALAIITGFFTGMSISDGEKFGITGSWYLQQLDERYVMDYRASPHAHKIYCDTIIEFEDKILETNSKKIYFNKEPLGAYTFFVYNAEKSIAYVLKLRG
jgi:hypothetical protein